MVSTVFFWSFILFLPFLLLNQLLAIIIENYNYVKSIVGEGGKGISQQIGGRRRRGWRQGHPAADRG